MEIRIGEEITGSILDVGGGGEGIIGRTFGDRVTAIDNRQEELDEAPDTCRKLLMDAASLDFPDGSFDSVTFFYSLMYMDSDTQGKAVREALRVLKAGGVMYIWDADIVSAYPDPFIVELDIRLPRETVHTTYGIVKKEPQDAETVLRLLRDAGQDPCLVSGENGQFFIRCVKA